ncbi:hypothetical protein HDU79_011605, partial [Rhizoclosmatium sp. JEL0117]
MHSNLLIVPLAGCLLVVLSYLALINVHTPAAGAVHNHSIPLTASQTCSTVVINSIPARLCFKSKEDESSVKEQSYNNSIRLNLGIENDQLTVSTQNHKRHLLLTAAGGDVKHFHAINRLIWSLRDTGSMADVAIFHPESSKYNSTFYNDRFGGVFTVPYTPYKADRPIVMERFIQFADWMDKNAINYDKIIVRVQATRPLPLLEKQKLKKQAIVDLADPNPGSYH